MDCRMILARKSLTRSLYRTVNQAKNTAKVWSSLFTGWKLLRDLLACLTWKIKIFELVSNKLSTQTNLRNWLLISLILSPNFYVNSRGPMRGPNVCEGRLHRGFQLQGTLRLRIASHLSLQPGLHIVGECVQALRWRWNLDRYFFHIRNLLRLIKN